MPSKPHVAAGVAAAVALAATTFPGLHVDAGTIPSTPPELVGVSAPSHRAAIAAEQSGTISEMVARPGAHVRVGDPLFRLTATLQRLEVERLRAEIRSSIEIERANAKLQHAEAEAARMRRLAEQKMSADADLQDAELQLRLARLTVARSEFDRRLKQNDLEQAEARLAQRTLRSPLDGIVTRLIKHLGETAEQLEPIVEVIALDPLWVQFECPVALERHFPIGGSVRVRPFAGVHEPRVGTILHVAPQATVAGQTVMIRAVVANPDYSWRSGLKMHVAPAPTPATPAPQGK